jgi:hypothetical protein
MCLISKVWLRDIQLARCDSTRHAKGETLSLRLNKLKCSHLMRCSLRRVERHPSTTGLGSVDAEVWRDYMEQQMRRHDDHVMPVLDAIERRQIEASRCGKGAGKRRGVLVVGPTYKYPHTRAAARPPGPARARDAQPDNEPCARREARPGDAPSRM